MSQSLVQIHLHLVFSTKDRKPFLTDRKTREEVHKSLGGLCKKLECPVLCVGGVADHVHILCRLGKAIEVKDLLKELKRDSSQWIKMMSPELAGFYWQVGYGAFSVSPSHVEDLRRYIANQEEHHKTETFQEEFLRILKKYGVEYDERYLWE